MSATPRIGFTLLAAALLAGCGVEFGSGRISTEQRSIDAFTRISVQSGIHATVTLGAREVSLSTDDNILPTVETYLEGETLILRVRPDRFVSTSYGIRATITNEALEALTASGGSQVNAVASAAVNWPIAASGGSQVAVSEVSATQLTLDASGGSQVTATGQATGVSVTGSGGSHLDSDGVFAENVTVSGSGGSDLKVRATKTARGQLSGGSQATVSGEPTIREIGTSGGSQVTWVTQ